MTLSSVNEASGGAAFAYVEMPVREGRPQQGSRSSGFRRIVGLVVLALLGLLVWPGQWPFSLGDLLVSAALRLPSVALTFNEWSGPLLATVAGIAVLMVLWPAAPRLRPSAPRRVTIRSGF